MLLYQGISIAFLTGWGVPYVHWILPVSDKIGFPFSMACIFFYFSTIASAYFSKLARFYLELSGALRMIFIVAEYALVFTFVMSVSIQINGGFGLSYNSEALSQVGAAFGRIGVSMVMLLTFVVSLYFSIRKRSKLGVWTLLSLLPNLIFSLLYLHYIDRVFETAVAKHYSLIGSSLQSLSTLAALGYKIKSKEDKLHGAIEGLNKELMEVNSDLEHQVEEKTRDTKAVLANLSQGIFTVSAASKDFAISKDYSEALEGMIGQENLAGKSPFDEIFSRSDLDQEKIDMLKNAFFSLDADIIQWELLADSLPKEFHLDEKLIECSFDVITEEDIIEKIIVSLRDVTQLNI